MHTKNECDKAATPSMSNETNVTTRGGIKILNLLKGLKCMLLYKAVGIFYKSFYRLFAESMDILALFRMLKGLNITYLLLGEP